jgi:hypothetical protein
MLIRALKSVTSPFLLLFLGGGDSPLLLLVLTLGGPPLARLLTLGSCTRKHMAGERQNSEQLFLYAIV